MANKLPKYIIKRMIPPDSVVKKDDGVEFTLVNILSPLNVKELPDDAISMINAKINGVPIDEEMKQKVRVNINGKDYTAQNFKELEGEVIPVGAEIKVFAPYEVERGKEYELSLEIEGVPFNFTVTRKVN